MVINQRRKLSQLISERNLAKFFGLDLGAGGRSTAIGYLIRDGLRCLKIGGKRFFWEQEVVDFLEKQSKTEDRDSEDSNLDRNLPGLG